MADGHSEEITQLLEEFGDDQLQFVLELEAYEAEQMQTEKEKARRQARSQTLFNSLKMNQASIPRMGQTT